MASILIVEDDFGTLSLLNVILGFGGRYKITSANDGAQALEKLGLEPENETVVLPDLIVMDIMMPKLDGYSVIQRLANNFRTRAIPIIVVTAKNRMRDMLTVSPNVAGFIDKPFEERTLREMVSKALGSKNSQSPPPGQARK